MIHLVNCLILLSVFCTTTNCNKFGPILQKNQRMKSLTAGQLINYVYRKLFSSFLWTRGGCSSGLWLAKELSFHALFSYLETFNGPSLSCIYTIHNAMVPFNGNINCSFSMLVQQKQERKLDMIKLYLQK